MSVPSSWSLQEMWVWHQWGHLQERTSQWQNPWAFRFPQNLNDAEAVLTGLQRRLDPPLWRCLLKAAVSAALGRKWEPGAEDFLDLVQRFVTLSELGFDLDWEHVRRAGWALAALPTARGPKAHIFWALIGAIPDSPSFHAAFSPVATLEPTARAALERAHRLFRERTQKAMAFLALVPPLPPNVSIQGPSWALPAYLGAWEAHLGNPAPQRTRRVAATGDVDHEGNILPVGFVKEKAKAAARAGFRVMFCPWGSADTCPPSAGLQLLEVKDLQAAEFLWELEETGAEKASLRDLERLRSPEDLAAGLRSLDPRLRGWSGFPDTYARTVRKVMQNPRDAERFTESMERLFSGASVDLGWMETLLAPIGPKELQEMAGQAFFTSFRLAHLRWAVAVQKGDADEALRWADYCRSYPMERLSAYPEGIDRIADFCNRRFVTEYHALYRFCPELPEWLTEMRDKLESVRETQAINGIKPARPSLGKLYGTIAQNYGFCGPMYLEECQRSVSSAKEAFGGLKVPELEKDCRRQYHYLVCAFLDADKADEAQAALENYLGSPLEEVNPAALNRYQHAALARFLADTDLRLPHYEAWCRNHLKRSLTEHPWQLWLWNVGRRLPENEAKRDAWHKGLALCRRLGLTARPMALLHAAWLFREGLAASTVLDEVVQDVLAEISGSRLHMPHFADLFSKTTWQAVLESIAAHPARWFPFTYR